jgi:hypothetical protein
MMTVTLLKKQFLTFTQLHVSLPRLQDPQNRFITPTIEMAERYCTTFHKQLLPQVNKDSTSGIAANHENVYDKHLHYISF